MGLVEAYPHLRWTEPANERARDMTFWDRMMLEDFVAAIRGERPPPFDVYAAANMSAVIPMSAQSLADGGSVVTFPDFRSGKR